MARGTAGTDILTALLGGTSKALEKQQEKKETLRLEQREQQEAIDAEQRKQQQSLELLQRQEDLKRGTLDLQAERESEADIQTRIADFAELLIAADMDPLEAFDLAEEAITGTRGTRGDRRKIAVFNNSSDSEKRREIEDAKGDPEREGFFERNRDSLNIPSLATAGAREPRLGGGILEALRVEPKTQEIVSGAVTGGLQGLGAREQATKKSLTDTLIGAGKGATVGGGAQKGIDEILNIIGGIRSTAGQVKEQGIGNIIGRFVGRR